MALSNAYSAVFPNTCLAIASQDWNARDLFNWGSNLAGQSKRPCSSPLLAKRPSMIARICSMSLGGANSATLRKPCWLNWVSSCALRMRRPMWLTLWLMTGGWRTGTTGASVIMLTQTRPKGSSKTDYVIASGCAIGKTLNKSGDIAYSETWGVTCG